MSKPSTIFWDTTTTNTQSIALPQFVSSEENVTLNANVQGSGSFAYNNIVRSIYIYSTVDISGSSFHVSGIGATVDIASGNPSGLLGPISEDIVGPAALITPSASVNIYSQIDSISVSGTDAFNVYIGFGDFGATDYIFMDYNRNAPTAFNMTLQVTPYDILVPPTIAVTGWVSFNKPTMSGIPFGVENGQEVTFITGLPIIAPTSSQAITGGPFMLPIAWASVATKGSDAFYFTILQQGIK